MIDPLDTENVLRPTCPAGPPPLLSPAQVRLIEGHIFFFESSELEDCRRCADTENSQRGIDADYIFMVAENADGVPGFTDDSSRYSVWLMPLGPVKH